MKRIKLKPKRVTHAQLIERSLLKLRPFPCPPSVIIELTENNIRNMEIGGLFLRVDEYYMLRGFRVFGDSIYSTY